MQVYERTIKTNAYEKNQVGIDFVETLKVDKKKKKLYKFRGMKSMEGQ